MWLKYQQDSAENAVLLLVPNSKLHEKRSLTSLQACNVLNEHLVPNTVINW